MNSPQIVRELDELEALLLQCRSVFPTLPKGLIGHREFNTAPYYSGRGYEARIQLKDPITAEFIEQNRRLGKSINENAIIRLYGIMKYYGFLKEIDQTLPGWRAVDLMRRMRNAFTKTPLSYRPDDPDNIRLREEVIKYFGLTKEIRAPFSEEIPTSIDSVIEPLFGDCRKYIEAKRTNSEGAAL
jgi:hypothetical protein